MSKDVSFVIPVYNTDENLLIRCLESIKRQKMISNEIIIIDDGSDPIKSRNYKKVAKKYESKYFYQEKKGVSSARNCGLAIATGKYIFFVDSDDELADNSINKLDFSTDYPDLVIYDVKKIDKDKKINQKYKLNATQIPTDNQMNIEFIKNDLLNWSVGKLYKKSFLLSNNLLFNSQKMSGEDFEFVYTTYKCKPIIKYIPRVVYFYLYRDATGEQRILTNPQKNISDILAMYQIRKKLLDNEDLSEYNIFLCEKVVNDLFNNYLVLLKNKVIEKFPNYNIAINELDSAFLKKMSLKYKIKIYALKHKDRTLAVVFNKLFLIKRTIKRK